MLLLVFVATVCLQSITESNNDYDTCILCWYYLHGITQSQYEFICFRKFCGFGIFLTSKCESVQPISWTPEKQIIRVIEKHPKQLILRNASDVFYELCQSGEIQQTLYYFFSFAQSSSGCEWRETKQKTRQGLTELDRMMTEKTFRKLSIHKPNKMRLVYNILLQNLLFNSPFFSCLFWEFRIRSKHGFLLLWHWVKFLICLKQNKIIF